MTEKSYSAHLKQIYKMAPHLPHKKRSLLLTTKPGYKISTVAITVVWALLSNDIQIDLKYKK